MDCIVSTDGHTYVVGKIDGVLYLLRDDGEILFEKNATNDNYYIGLYEHVFRIYDRDKDVTYWMSLEGDILNPDGVEIRQTNDALVFTEEGKFTVYPFHISEVYVVEDKEYSEGRFWYTEWETSPYLTPYGITNEKGESLDKSSFLGLRTIDGYAQISQVGDYFIMHNSKYVNDEYIFLFELIDWKGNSLYCANVNERITGVYLGEDIYVAITSGNYDMIQDLDGNIIYREISNKLSDD